MSARFLARHPGKCANGDRITIGDLCTYSDDELVHVDCDATPVDPDAPGRHERRCADCFTIHAGKCM